jgi:hypothetical protein
MDIKDVYIASGLGQAWKTALSERTATTVAAQQLSSDNLKPLPDARTLSTNIRNKKIESTNYSISSVNLITVQTDKITSLLKSVVGMASQASKAPDEQISKLQDEVTQIMAEIQKAGKKLRGTFHTLNLDPTKMQASEAVLDEIAPEPPTEPPLLTLSTEVGILMTQNIIAKVQAQFIALQDSLGEATKANRTNVQTLRTSDPIQTDEDAFKATVALVKDVGLLADGGLGAMDQELLKKSVVALR